MPPASDAVDNATRLDEIEFPEFTSKLIEDTFNAIVTSMIRQQEAYADLVEKVSMSVSEFEQEAVIDRDVTDWLIGKFPGEESGTTAVGTTDEPGTLTKTDLEILNRKLGDEAEELNLTLPAPDDASGSEGEEPTLELSGEQVTTIRKCVRRDIAGPRLEALKDLVSQGIVRVVVDDGTIETKLNFNTNASEYTRQTDTEYDRSSTSAGANAGLSLGSFNVGGYANHHNTSVSTMTKREMSSSEASVDIMGRVEINIRGDYQPLRPNEGGGFGESE
ncbi:hypothetical protein [Halococcoides cellulosivorans]|uniref:Uncharacterized protein n=1 Tax=Halococcoides cellulosivorans TaxID=1679096 RepID=A0A2R4X181_9EURY|nr:hypothetical protein [Halococcoides cellulosivorans]AWB27554.1 hypothetical protein HARCEL1_07445 [Halococcoides cellulosivorans]